MTVPATGTGRTAAASGRLLHPDHVLTATPAGPSAGTLTPQRPVPPRNPLLRLLDQRRCERSQGGHWWHQDPDPQVGYWCCQCGYRCGGALSGFRTLRRRAGRITGDRP